ARGPGRRHPGLSGRPDGTAGRQCHHRPPERLRRYRQLHHHCQQLCLPGRGPDHGQRHHRSP
ncbi:30S ribosomal protein S21, partial [Dysosmobacter welbionis]